MPQAVHDYHGWHLTGTSLPPCCPAGRALGDAWLASAKGKKPVPGPEARRGRANLFDVLQQAPAPAVRLPGQVTGDAWLDARGRR